MVPAIGSRTNAKIVTARAAGLALTLVSRRDLARRDRLIRPACGGPGVPHARGGRGDLTGEHVVWPGRCPACPVIAACQGS
jgi:hypothetical protein